MNKELWALIAGLAAVGTVKRSIGSLADRKSELDRMGFWGSEAAGIMLYVQRTTLCFLVIVLMEHYTTKER